MKRSHACGALVAALLICLSAVEAQGPQGRRPRARAEGTAEHSRNALALRQALSPLARQHRLSVVRVWCGGNQVALGTVISADGLIITKASELEGAIEVQLAGEARRYPARKLGRDEPNDLALLQLVGVATKPITLAPDNATRIGSVVVTVDTDEVPPAYGVMSVGRHPRKLRIQLGVFAEAIAAGIKLTRIQPETAGAAAGLRPEDVILAIAGEPVLTMEAFRELIQRHGPGSKMRLRVRRGDGELDLVAEMLDVKDRRGPVSSQERSRLWGPLSKVRLGFDEVIQHDTVLRPEQCGGPLVNLDGEVVGINIARVGRIETLAITAKVARDAIAGIMQKRDR